MQSLKILMACLLFTLGAQAQVGNNSMSGNRLSSFNVAHTGLDGNQINFSGILNNKYGSNNSLLFETRLGKSNFSVSGLLENSSGPFYSSNRKQLGLSYRLKLNNDKTLSFGLGYGKANGYYLSTIAPTNFLNRDFHVSRFGTMYAGKRFKVGAEFVAYTGGQGTNSSFASLNLLYQQNIINRDNFKLNSNLVISNFNSSLEFEMLFKNRYSLVTGYDMRRGAYLGVGYRISDNFEFNVSTSAFSNYSTQPSLQLGLKINF